MSAALSDHVSLTPVTTILSPAERQRVDAVGEGFYRAIHRETADEVLRDLRENHAGAVVLSTARCDEGSGWVRRMVREFPRVPTVALLTQLEPRTPHTVLALGQLGVQTLVDARQPAGWRQLRSVLLTDQTAEIDRLALAHLATDLAGVPDECWRFFEALFRRTHRLATIRDLARELDVVPSTLMSRFFRVRLPPPKRYLATVRLVRAARLFENPGLSVANVAHMLEFSSPQSFGRHVRTLLGMGPVAFRQRYDGEGMLMRLRQELVLPYLDILRRFHPLSTPPLWSEPGDTRPSPSSAAPVSRE